VIWTDNEERDLPIARSLPIKAKLPILNLALRHKVLGGENI